MQIPLNPQRVTTPISLGGAFSPGALPVPTQAGTDTFYRSQQDVQAERFKDAGNEMRKLRLYPQAEQAYQTAINIKPNYTDAYYNMAQLFAITGNLFMAVQKMTQLLFINPNDHDARVQLGEYYERARFPQEAKKRYME